MRYLIVIIASLTFVLINSAQAFDYSNNVSPSAVCGWSVHEFTDELGDIIRTIPSPAVSQGDALVGCCYADDMLILLENQDPAVFTPKMYKIDPDNGTILGEVNLPFQGFVMDCDWDGSQLWIMKWYGATGYENSIYKVDLEGNLLGEIPLNFGSYYTGRGLTVENDHIWVGANANYANETKLYKLDLTGAVLETYDTPGVVGWFMGMTVDSQAPMGSNIFMVDNIGQTIKRLSVAGGTVSIVEQFGSPVVSTDYAEGICFDGEYLWHNAALGQQNVIWLLDDGIEGGAPDVSIMLTPINPPIIIPAAGGSFNYTVNITNNESSAVNFNAWIDITLPNGSTYGPVINRNLTVNPGYSINRQLTQNVPPGAPAGEYSYNGYVGIYLGEVWDSSNFAFSKSGTDYRVGGSDWIVSGWDDEPNAFAAVPEEFNLSQNYPNPFNPETSISITLPQNCEVRLTVYNLLGEEIAALVDGYLDAGVHEVIFSGEDLTSGIYIYSLKAGDYRISKKMALIK